MVGNNRFKAIEVYKTDIDKYVWAVSCEEGFPISQRKGEMLNENLQT